MIDKSESIDTYLDQIRLALEEKNTARAVSILVELYPADQAEIFNYLTEDERDVLFEELDLASKADILEKVEDIDVLDAIEELPSEQLANILDEMEPDEAADLLGDLPPEQVYDLLPQMEDLDEVLPLLGHPDETAGSLMTTWYIALRRQTTVEQAIEFLRGVDPETSFPYYLYVIDSNKRLVGVVGLRDLVVSTPMTLMESIMDLEVISVKVGTDQEEVAHIMACYDVHYASS